MSYIMKCGHVSNDDLMGSPVCFECFGSCSEAEQVDDNAMEFIKGRNARCRRCGTETKSDVSLGRFQLNRQSLWDSYTCLKCIREQQRTQGI